jgi:L-lysine exporter family protein LysE/ArgO
LARIIVDGFVLGVLVSLPVGPVSIGLVQRALKWGFWNATLFGAGSASADLLYIGLVYLGIAPLLAERLWLRVTLWGLGALWLAWLGVGAIRSALRQPDADLTHGGDSHWQSYVAGAGITLLNPLTIVGWLTLGGAYFALYPETRTLGGGLLGLLAIIGGLMAHVIGVSALMAAGRRWVGPGLVRGVSAAAGVLLLWMAAGFLWSAVQGVLGSTPA